MGAEAINGSGFTNPEFVERATEQVREGKREDVLSRAEALATKRRLEEKREVDREVVKVPIDGEDVPLYPLDAGTALSYARRAIEAERNNDLDERVVAMDDMRQEFVDRGYFPDVFDREFWNAFDPDTLREAWREWGQRSRGGDDAGNS